MNWTDLKITVSTKDAETAEAIAQMAVPYGIYIEDYSDMLELVPQIAHIDLIDEDLLARSRTEAILHLYLPPEENPAEASAFLTHRLEAEGIPYRIETDQTLAEEDWANAWKRFYHPTHLLEQLPVEHTRILDMGTGSGILSIAALMLGAQEAVGVDIDKVAVRTAAENAEVNGFGPDRFTAVTADLIHQPLEEELTRGGFDIVLANIVADVIIALAPAIYHHLKSGGHLVASGIILPRKEEVIAALETEGMVITQEKEQDGWCALLMQKA